MGNRYSSNIRTYTARNLVWNTVGASPVPFIVNAPTALTVRTPNDTAHNSMLPVFYNAQYRTDVNNTSAGVNADWNRNSFITIKRAGIFCNFADGLVQKMDTSRVTMAITASVYQDAGSSYGGSINYTAGANGVSGTGLNIGSITPGAVIVDDSDPNGLLYPYFIQKAASGSPGTAYLTDYAKHTSPAPTAIHLFSLGSNPKQKSFLINNIATLNTMYEAEIFFPYTPVLATDRLLISCQLGIDGGDQSLDFLTNTIDPSFNGRAVSFDSVIEVEVTPV